MGSSSSESQTCALIMLQGRLGYPSCFMGCANGMVSMASVMRIERARRNFTNESNRYDVKRERLVRCARALGEQDNAAKVSVTDVTTEMGITRGLFYYYFGGKGDLNKAVADTYIADLEAAINEAIAMRADDREGAIEGLVEAVREWFFDDEGAERPMIHVLREVSLQEYAYSAAADSIVRIMREHGLLSDYGKIGDDAVITRARFVAFGILGDARLHRENELSLQADAACASLRYRKRRTKE